MHPIKEGGIGRGVLHEIVRNSFLICRIFARITRTLNSSDGRKEMHKFGAQFATNLCNVPLANASQNFPEMPECKSFKKGGSFLQFTVGAFSVKVGSSVCSHSPLRCSDALSHFRLNSFNGKRRSALAKQVEANKLNHEQEASSCKQTKAHPSGKSLDCTA